METSGDKYLSFSMNIAHKPRISHLLFYTVYDRDVYLPVLGLPPVRVGSLSLETLELVGIGIAVDKVLHIEVSLATYEATRVFLSLTDFIAPQPISQHDRLT